MLPRYSRTWMSWGDRLKPQTTQVAASSRTFSASFQICADSLASLSYDLQPGIRSKCDVEITMD